MHIEASPGQSDSSRANAPNATPIVFTLCTVVAIAYKILITLSKDSSLSGTVAVVLSQDRTGRQQSPLDLRLSATSHYVLTWAGKVVQTKELS